MTRHDYERLAAALKNVAPRPGDDDYTFHQHRIDCEAIANEIAHSSTKFDRALFLRNCGVQS